MRPVAAVDVDVTPAGLLRRLPAWSMPVATGSVVAAAAVFAAVVPPHGQSFYPRCPLYEVTGILCPACGATRAVSALCSGHLGTAVHDNLVLVALVPLLALVWLGWLARSVGAGGRLARVARLRWPPAMTTVVPVALLVYAVARNLPFAPFRALVPLS